MTLLNGDARGPRQGAGQAQRRRRALRGGARRAAVGEVADGLASWPAAASPSRAWSRSARSTCSSRRSRTPARRTSSSCRSPRSCTDAMRPTARSPTSTSTSASATSPPTTAPCYLFHCVEIADGTRTIEVGAAVEFDLLLKLGADEAADLRRRGVSDARARAQRDRRRDRRPRPGRGRHLRRRRRRRRLPRRVAGRRLTSSPRTDDELPWWRVVRATAAWPPTRRPAGGAAAGRGGRPCATAGWSRHRSAGSSRGRSPVAAGAWRGS